MAKFKFQLATLMRLREATRDERRAALAEAYQAQQKLRERLAEKQEELFALRGSYSQAAAPGRVEVDRLLYTQRYELVLRSELKMLEDQSLLITTEVEKRRLTLVEADRELRVLEKLRDKQHERFQYAEQCKEMKQLDEVAAGRQAREVC